MQGGNGAQKGAGGTEVMLGGAAGTPAQRQPDEVP